MTLMFQFFIWFEEQLYVSTKMSNFSHRSQEKQWSLIRWKNSLTKFQIKWESFDWMSMQQKEVFYLYFRIPTRASLIL